MIRPVAHPARFSYSAVLFSLGLLTLGAVGSLFFPRFVAFSLAGWLVWLVAMRSTPHFSSNLLSLLLTAISAALGILAFSILLDALPPGFIEQGLSQSGLASLSLPPFFFVLLAAEYGISTRPS